MDAISYSYADKQAKRIKKFIENPDSTSGIVTTPKVIEAGETVTIPAGRIAVLPNVQVDGDLVIDGDVFVPSGATFYDLDNSKMDKDINGLGDKTTPVDADEFVMADSTSAFSLKKLSFANLKATLLSYLSIGLSYSIEENGYIKLPNWISGLVIQWGRSTLVGGLNTDQSQLFPIAFPNSCSQVFVTTASGETSTNRGVQYKIETKTLTGFTWSSDEYASPSSGVRANYIAIGK